MKNNSFFVLLSIFVEIQSLVKLPLVEDNSIATTVPAIQNTVNNLFTSFKIQNIKHSHELKQNLAIHNLFVSITLRDCNNWKKIVSLSRVNDLDNKTIYFITQINEVLNRGVNDKSVSGIDDNNNTHAEKLEYLKEWYGTKRKDFMKSKFFQNIHKKLLQLKNDVKYKNNKTIDGSKDTLLNNDFWRPSGRRIYQGTRTRIKDFPFMASVQFFGKFQCGGSIIKSDLVITAASCLQLAWNNRFFRENPAYLSVQIGSQFYEHGGESVQVQEVYFHPKYVPKTLRHNLAVMRLSRKIAFKSKTRKVKKIDIDRNANPLIAKDRITIIGWGARDRSNIIYDIVQNRLSYAKLDFYPLDECQEYYSKEYVTKRNFCAGFYSKGSGACNRDVGGPGVIDGVLMGVISFASPVCGAPGPTVFTKVGFYADWIEDIMNQDVPSIAVATTKLRPPIYYNYINTKTSPIEPNFTPIGDTTTPWEKMGMDNDLALRTIADKVDDNGYMLPILNNQKNKYFEYLDTTSKLPPKMSNKDFILGDIIKGDDQRYIDVLPFTIGSESYRYTQTTSKIQEKPVFNRVKEEDVTEKHIIKIIHDLDIDRIVKSVAPVSRLETDLKRIMQHKRMKTTKRNNIVRETHKNWFDY